jgi:subtilisin family serine protease
MYPGAPPRPGPDWPRALLVAGTALLGLWIVGATATLQLVGWFGADVADGSGGHVTGALWAVLTWLNAAVVGLPAAGLWFVATRVPTAPAGVREVGRAWTLVAVATGVVGSARAVPTPHNELLLLLTAILAVALASGLRRLRRPMGTTGNAAAGVGWSVTAGLLSLLPWLWAGSLGGLTETLLAVLAAAAAGWLFASIVDGTFFAAFARSRVLLVLVGGLAVGAALVPFGAALGGRGVNLAELAVLPAVGIAAAAVAAGVTPQRLGPLPLTALVGLAALGPLAFVDPEETSLLLGLSDAGFWVFVGSALGVGVGLVVSIGYGLAVRPTVPRPVVAVLTVLAVLAAVGVYTLAGRPGLYGERLFVVLRDQADLSGLAAIPDRDARLAASYQRLVTHAQQTQAPLRGWMDRWHLRYTPYYLVNGLLVDGGPAVRAWLSTRSDVDRVLLDPRLRPLPVAVPTERGPAEPPDGSPQWNITQIRADTAWAGGAEGQGIVVGSSDSGVDGAHPLLRNSFRGGDDSWLDPWNGTTTPTDHAGHGTHTMGTVLAPDGIGVAPKAQWMGCVNLDRNAASPSRYLDCLQFMLAPYPAGADPLTAGRPERAAHVLTNSWGCPGEEGCDLDALRPAVAALRAAGIFFAAAAGNTGPSCGSVDDPPAPYRDTFTVGAVDADGVVAPFSSRGPTPDGVVKPDVLAPGVDVFSTMPDGTYAELSGTSMATPHIAGVVALMWSANARLIGDIPTTERILRETASPARVRPGEPACAVPQDITGAGLVDAAAAVAAARAA